MKISQSPLMTTKITSTTHNEKKAQETGEKIPKSLSRLADQAFPYWSFGLSIDIS